MNHLDNQPEPNQIEQQAPELDPKQQLQIDLQEVKNNFCNPEGKDPRSLKSVDTKRFLACLSYIQDKGPDNLGVEIEDVVDSMSDAFPEMRKAAVDEYATIWKSKQMQNGAPSEEEHNVAKLVGEHEWKLDLWAYIDRATGNKQSPVAQVQTVRELNEPEQVADLDVSTIQGGEARHPFYDDPELFVDDSPAETNHKPGIFSRIKRRLTGNSVSATPQSHEAKKTSRGKKLLGIGALAISAGLLFSGSGSDPTEQKTSQPIAAITAEVDSPASVDTETAIRPNIVKVGKAAIHSTSPGANSIHRFSDNAQDNMNTMLANINSLMEKHPDLDPESDEFSTLLSNTLDLAANRLA